MPDTFDPLRSRGAAVVHPPDAPGVGWGGSIDRLVPTESLRWGAVLSSSVDLAACFSLLIFM